MSKPYIIAEMGVNFYDTARVMNISLIDAAKLYIDKAAEAASAKRRNMVILKYGCTDFRK